MKDPTHDLRRAMNGDRDALRGVVQAWWPRMRRWALVQTGDPVVAEDAVQDALVRVIRNIHRYDPNRPFGPWLRTVVRNAAQDGVRKRGRNHLREAVMTGDEGSEPGTERRLDLKRSAQRALERFQKLPARQRTLVEMVDLDGHTPTEAAEHLGISASAARAQLCAARKTLRTGLRLEAPEILPLLREA